MRARTLVGGALLLVALGALAVVLLAMPAGHRSFWGQNPGGAAQWAAALGVGGHPLPAEAFRRALVVLLAACWGAYALALSGGGPALRGLVPSVALGMALLFPPALSSDAYAYAAFGRLRVLHGLDPYATSQLALRGLADPAAPFLSWDLPSPYGPLWTLLCVAVVAAVRDLGGEVLVFKLIAALALVALARVARRLAPERGELAYLAVGLNPALLIEGPGTGHNDVALMLPMALACLVLARGGPTPRAWLLVGAGVAVKWVALLAAPWLVLARGRRLGWAGRPLDALGVAAAVAGPTALLALAFAEPGEALTGVRRHLGVHAAATWSLAVVAAVYVAACAAVVRRGEAALPSAWVLTTLALAAQGPLVFAPWYAAWPLALAWTGRARLLPALACAVAAGLMLLYARAA